MKISNVLKETFNTPVKWKILSRSINEIVYQFFINDLEFIAIFDRNLELFDRDYKSDPWIFDFGLKDAKGDVITDLTKTGHQFEVFSTIVEIIKDFVKSNRPNKIIFTASKVDEGRTRVYNKVLKKLINELPGWTYNIKIDDEVGNDVNNLFILSKK